MAAPKPSAPRIRPQDTVTVRRRPNPYAVGNRVSVETAAALARLANR